MVVYVTRQGADIVREGRHLLVKKDGTTFHTLFIHKLEQIIICGRVSLTVPALQLLFQEQIDTVFLKMDGRYCGRLASAEGKNVFLRKKQFALVDDDNFCLRQARAFVTGKLRNMLTLLQRIGRTAGKPDVSVPINTIQGVLRQLASSTSVEQLRGYEGAATAAYFSGFRCGLSKDYGFSRRIRRPPTDPVNALLSLLYTFLINRLYAAVRIAGLDPQPGVLHQLDYGRHALPLDLVEEFRAPLADSLTLALLNRRILTENDFIIHQPEAFDLPPVPETAVDHAVNDTLGRMNCIDAEEQFDLPDQDIPRSDSRTDDTKEQRLPVRLRPEAFKKVIEAFEKKLQVHIFHPLAQQKMTYAEALVHQARIYRRVVNSEQQEYQPLLLR